MGWSWKNSRCLVAAAVALLAARASAWGQGGEQAPTASQRGQVVVLRPPDVDEVTRTALARVTGELTAARFQVTVVPLDPALDPTPQVETVAPQLRPVAAFAIAHAPGSVGDTITIWVCDRLGRRTTIQRMTTHSGDVSQDAEALALEAIELIRVSIAGLWPAHIRAPAEAAEVVGVPARNTPELSVGLGVAMLEDVALSSTEWMGSMSAMVKWPSGIAVHGQLRGLGPTVAVPGSYGTGSLRRTAALFGAGWVFWAAERIRSSVMLAAGVEHLAATGAAEDAARAHSVSSWSTLVSAGVGASARLNSVLAFALELHGVITIPPTVLRIGSTETRQLSQPGLVLTSALQARF